MAKMLGQRLTLLQVRSATVRLTMEQIQMMADGLVANRSNIVEDRLDLYDSQAMDFFEQLESQEITFPDLVLGEDPAQTAEEIEQLDQEFARVSELLRRIGSKFKLIADMSRPPASFGEQRLKLAEAGMEDIIETYHLIFGENPEWAK